MRIFHQKTVFLIVFLITFAFIAIGLTLGYYQPLGAYDSAATAYMPPLP